MYPNLDTITNNPEGLKNYQIGYAAYKSLPSFINDNFKEGLSNEETASVALFNAIKNNEFITADEFGSEKGRLSDLGLDKDLLGNTLLRKSLGYLSSKDELDKLCELMYEYVYYGHFYIDKLDRIEYMQRDISIITDTDSTIISLDAWYRFVLEKTYNIDMDIRKSDID